jgi:hypothetical protein
MGADTGRYAAVYSMQPGACATVMQGPVVGRGTYGNVYRGLHTATQRTVALKKVR